MTQTSQTQPYESPPGALYDPAVAKMQRLSVENARRTFGDVIKSAAEQQVHTVVTRHGADMAVVVDRDFYRRAREALGDPTEL